VKFGIFRNKLCCKFAEALNKESRPDLTPIRVKELYDLECVETLFPKYVMPHAGLSDSLPNSLCMWSYSLSSTCVICDTFL
jgi:hypothetical protein